MRKGFLHVVEALIVIMLIFSVLSQFYTIPRPQHQWSSTKLTLMAQDLLYTMDEKGVDWFSFTDVNATLYDALPRTMGYALRTKQSVRPVMNVGCVCNNDNFTTIQGILSYFPLNGVDRNFNLERITPGNMDFDLDGIHFDNDVIIFLGSPTLTSSEAQNLSEYLRAGNGVVQYAGLTQAEVESPWHGETFKLKWVDATSTRPSDTDAEFQALSPTENAYEAMKIYNAINSESDFSNFGEEKVYPSDDTENRILLKQAVPYSGGDYDRKSVPLAVVNWAVHGMGRTGWMSNGSLTDTRNSDLLKAIVIWAAGGKDYILIDDIMTENAKSSMRKILNADMYEPVNIELTLGYHF